MKYNKSEIMKNAWEAYKARKLYPAYDYRSRVTFADCLRQAWFSAKESARQAIALASMIGKKFCNDMEITIDYVTYTLRRWTNYGKDRVYVTGGKNRSGHYVDLMSSYDNVVHGDQLVSIIRSLQY